MLRTRLASGDRGRADRNAWASARASARRPESHKAIIRATWRASASLLFGKFSAVLSQLAERVARPTGPDRGVRLAEQIALPRRSCPRGPRPDGVGAKGFASITSGVRSKDSE